MKIPGSRHEEFRALMDHFVSTLAAASAERAERRGLAVDEHGCHEVAWVLHERQVMWEAVNRARSDRGLPTAPLEAVARAERLAVGHCDYARKWALGCAELALSPDVEAAHV